MTAASGVVADLGNSRLKWGRVDASGALAEVVALPNDDPAAWSEAWGRWGLAGGISWRVASVNPPAADRLAEFLEGQKAGKVRWFRSAADVAVRTEVDPTTKAGADRALAVAGALTRAEHRGRPGVVVSCGTAITAERVGADGTWQGGAIGPGFGPMARALRLLTAQLPEVAAPPTPPPAWGRSTVPALEAGLFWSVVGSARELVARVGEGLGDPWLAWTGGDAEALARLVGGGSSVVAPHLVLEGLLRQAG